MVDSALYEWMRYDEDGQPLTCTYADYLLSTADVTPRIEIHHQDSPRAPLNPLGVKGAGESGTIAALAVIASAIEDAVPSSRRSYKGFAHHSGTIESVDREGARRGESRVKAAPFVYHAPEDKAGVLKLMSESTTPAFSPAANH